MAIEIKIDNLDGDEIAEFLEEHISDMKLTSPPESKHALDLDGLRSPEVTFWSVYESGLLVGCGALKEIEDFHGELKSMRVRGWSRGQGIGEKFLSHIVKEARRRNYHSVKLETGSMEYFMPARNLYLKYGFTYCKPFGSYELDSNSVFMEFKISAK